MADIHSSHCAFIYRCIVWIRHTWMHGKRNKFNIPDEFGRRQNLHLLSYIKTLFKWHYFIHFINSVFASKHHFYSDNITAISNFNQPGLYLPPGVAKYSAEIGKVAFSISGVRILSADLFRLEGHRRLFVFHERSTSCHGRIPSAHRWFFRLRRGSGGHHSHWNGNQNANNY